MIFFGYGRRFEYMVYFTDSYNVGFFGSLVAGQRSNCTTLVSM